MTRKLTNPMITALTDAYRDGISRIDGASYVLRGVKTNTAEALRRRGLVTDRTVGAFGQYVLTSDGVDAARTIIATIAAEDAAATEASLTAHMANAWSDDITRADGDGPIYRASLAALLADIRTAYPDVDAQTVYDYCSESGESVAHCVEYWRTERQAMEEEEAAAAAEDATAMQAYIFDLTFVGEPFTASLPIMAGSELEARRIAVRLADGNWGTLATITLTQRAPLVHVLDITPGMVIITDTGRRVEVAEVTTDAFGVYLTPLTGQTVYVSIDCQCAQVGSFNLG